MSDYEDYEDYEYDSDYSIDYGEEAEEANDEEYLIENKFYEAEDYVRSDPQKAIETYLEVIRLEEKQHPDEATWRFQAYEKLVSLYLNQGEFEQVVAHFKHMIGFATQVSKQQSTNSINKVIADVSRQATTSQQLNENEEEDEEGEQEGGKMREESEDSQEWVVEIYQHAMDVLREAKNDRLLFSTTVKFAQYLVQTRAFGRAESILLDLYTTASSSSGDGSSDASSSFGSFSQSSQLLEILSMRMGLAKDMGQTDLLGELYHEASAIINSTVVDSKVAAIVHREGGFLAMEQSLLAASDGAKQDFCAQAYSLFNEAFRAFQEGGLVRDAKKCLKMCVLANMLSESKVDPFSAQEAKVFEKQEDVRAMIQLEKALLEQNTDQFRELAAGIRDEDIRRYLSPVYEVMRGRILARTFRLSVEPVDLELLQTSLFFSSERETREYFLQLIFKLSTMTHPPHRLSFNPLTNQVVFRQADGTAPSSSSSSSSSRPACFEDRVERDLEKVSARLLHL